MMYIYSLSSPVDNLVRYVGKTDNPERRLKQTIIPSSLKRKCHKNSWIKSLLNKNLTPVMKILKEVPNEEWQYWEKYYIKFYKDQGCDLTNSPYFPGGEGFASGNKFGEISRKDWVKITYDKICPQCQSQFTVNARKKDLTYCNRSCSAKFNANKNKERDALKKRILTNDDIVNIIKRINDGEFVKNISKDLKINPSTIFRAIAGRITGTTKTEHKRNYIKGTDVKTCKLNEIQVKQIREKYLTNKYSQQEIATEFNVSQLLISKIVRKQLWKEV